MNEPSLPALGFVVVRSSLVACGVKRSDVSRLHQLVQLCLPNFETYFERGVCLRHGARVCTFQVCLCVLL
jgi:hypothetical protein